MRFPTKPPVWKSARNTKYFTALYHSTPPWLSKEQKKQYHAVYRKAREMRRKGKDVHVDHVVPLISDYVCGLNVPWNLEIIEAKPNMSKGNRYWPDCPWENADMFGLFEPQQLKLI